MTTTNALIEQVLGNLSSYTLRQDRTTHLTAALTASATTASLDSTENIGKGLMEIDDELIYVDSTDRVSSTITIAPYGRGYRGSTSASHASEARVTVSPTYPRIQVLNAINQTILSVFPRLFATASTTFTYVASRTAYNLPADFEDVLSLSWQTSGPTAEWLPIRRYRVDRTAATGSFAGGRSINLYDLVTPGRTVQVVYTKKPSELSSASSVFTTTTGLPSSCFDVIMYGAAYRLISFIDPARMSFTSPEANENDPNRPIGSGTNTSRFILALFQQRLAEEEQKLKAEYPIRVYFTT